MRNKIGWHFCLVIAYCISVADCRSASLQPNNSIHCQAVVRFSIFPADPHHSSDSSPVDVSIGMALKCNAISDFCVFRVRSSVQADVGKMLGEGCTSSTLMLSNFQTLLRSLRSVPDLLVI